MALRGADGQRLPQRWAVAERDDYEWQDVAGRYREAVAAQKAAEALVADLRAELESLAGGLPAEGGGIKLEYVERIGNVNWKKLAKDLAISETVQAEYRGQPTRYARITEA